MKRNDLKSIDACLFDAFTNKFYSESISPQDYQQRWAIIEGIKRFDPDCKMFLPTKARQDHVCVQGCKVEKNDIYFKFLAGDHWTADIIICAGCMAMILFFKNVDLLPPHDNTHWDISNNCPTCTGPATGMHDFSEYTETRKQ